MAHAPPAIFPSTVLGDMSPYPTLIFIAALILDMSKKGKLNNNKVKLESW